MKKRLEVTNLIQLSQLAKDRKSVDCPKTSGFSTPRPAAFMMNLPGAILVQLFDRGMFLYERKGKPKPEEENCDA